MTGILRKAKGSVTVEAAILVPIVVLSITALILASIMEYQQTGIQAAADIAAAAGAECWGISSKEIATGGLRKSELGGDGLYRRILDPKKEAKLQNIRDFADRGLDKSVGVLYGTRRAEAELLDWLVYKKVTVTVENEAELPENGSFSLFGLAGAYRGKTVSEAVAGDTPEFIRNTDFIIDLEKELEEKYPGLKDLGEKSRDAVSELKKKIGDFF